MRLLKQSWNPAGSFCVHSEAKQQLSARNKTRLVMILAFCGVFVTLLILEYYRSGFLLFCSGIFLFGIMEFFILPRLFPIMSSPGVLTVCNQHIILKPNEKTELWLTGTSVHEVPLLGFSKAEFKIRDLEQYQDLELFIPALNFSAPGKKSLLFLVKLEWLIHEDQPIALDKRSTISKIYNLAYDGIKANNLPQALCEYIRGIVSDMVCRVNEGREEVPFRGKFSTYTKNHLIATLSREESHSKSPFIDIRVTDFQVALCTEGKPSVLI